MAGAATNLTADALLKRFWPPRAVDIEVLENNPTWGILPKDTSWVGKSYHLPVTIGDTQGAGADHQAARGAKQPTSDYEFVLTPTSYYSFFSVQRKLLRMSRDGGAKAEQLGYQSRSGLRTWKRRVGGIYLFKGSGAGAIGTIASISTNTITLTSAFDMRNMERNATIVISIDDTGVAGVLPGTPLRITNVNPTTKVITCDQNITAAFPGALATHKIFYVGDYNAVPHGLDGWVPTADPGATAWFGVDRTQHITRLGGIRSAQQGKQPREAIMRTMIDVWSAGGMTDLIVLGSDDFGDFESELLSAGVVTATKVPAAPIGDYNFGIEYDAIKVKGPGSTANVVCDPGCPPDRFYALQKDSWVIASLGDMPYLDDTDGNRILREGTADALEGMWVGDMEIGCSAPGWQAVAQR